jgi:hypothetical protein
MRTYRLSDIEDHIWKKIESTRDVYIRLVHTADSRAAHGCGCGASDCPGFAFSQECDKYHPDASYDHTTVDTWWQNEEGGVVFEDPDIIISRLRPGTPYKGPKTLTKLKAR